MHEQWEGPRAAHFAGASKACWCRFRVLCVRTCPNFEKALGKVSARSFISDTGQVPIALFTNIPPTPGYVAALQKTKKGSISLCLQFIKANFTPLLPDAHRFGNT